jgi:hypothetical protein
MNWPQLLQELSRQGLIDPEALPQLEALDEHDRPPWFIRLLLGLGAWLASLFAVVCLLLAQLLNSELSLLVLGLILGLGATFLRRSIREGSNDFFNQLALAGMLTSQILVAVGLGWLMDELWAPVTMVFMALLIGVYPDRTGRFLTCLAMCAILAYLCLEYGWLTPAMVVVPMALTAGWLWLQAPRLASTPLGPALPPLSFASVVGCFALILILKPGYWTAAVLTLAVSGLAWRLSGRFWGPLGVAVLGLSTLSAPGIPAALGALMLGFYRRSLLLQGLAWIFLIVCGALYYYDLGLTLLAKSGLMALSGGVLLLVRWRLLR